MKKHLSVVLLLLIASLMACQSAGPDVQYAIEVTRLVTVVVTEGSNTALSATVTPSSEPEATESPAVSTTTTTTATSSASATPDGFPTPIVGRVYVAQQIFEHGHMFWLEPIDQLWVLSYDASGNPTWQIYEDTFEEGMPETDPAFLPPISGLYQPRRGFGLLWRENATVREQLGWGLAEEVGYLANYEYHYGGTFDANHQFVQGSGFHLVESISGETIQFNEGVWTWEARPTNP